MRGLDLIEQTLWILSILLEVTLALRLLWIGARAYKGFVSYLGFATLGSVVLFAFPAHQPSYAKAWIAVQIPGVILLYVAALETFARLAAHFAATDHRGRLVRYAQRTLTFLMAASVFVCAASAMIDARALKNKAGLAAALAFAFLLKRVVTSTLAVFLVLSALYFSRYRAELQRNLRWHGLLLTIFMSTLAVPLLLRNFVTTTNAAHLVNTLFLACSIAIFIAWTLLLTKHGEQMPVRQAVSEQQGARKRTELETLQAWLARLRSQRP